jgi:hypothetical protein
MLPGLMPDEVLSNGVNPRTKILFLMPLVIRKLNEPILDGSGFSRGEVSIPFRYLLLTMLRLWMPRSVIRAQPVQSPLSSTQWLNVYGHIGVVWEHVKAAFDIVVLNFRD